MKVYKFRDCFLNPTERRVLKDGNYLDLSAKAFDVLKMLVEKCGEVVTKDEILEHVWNGSFVEEGNLPVHISKLRRLLDETKSQPYIQTVPGSGYRFIAHVREASLEEWEKVSARVKPAPEKTPSEWTFDSIAILPLENESHDPEVEYLADGLTESFINSLSRLPKLKVIARNTVFRYKDKNVDPKEVGETLGVATILTGRIRLIKDRLIIGIELTKTDDRTQLWGTHFNRTFTDIFEIQESIISEVLEQLKSEINNASKRHSFNAITKNSESYRLYLKGKHLLDKRTEESIYKAIECFQKSVSYDPTNVHSYVEIIESYLALNFSDYISYSNALTQIKPILFIVSKLEQLVDIVQSMHALRKLYLEWNFEEGKKHLLSALKLNPNCLIAKHRYSDYLLLSGRFTESLEELQQLLMLDPLSASSYKRIGRLLYKMERFESAITYLSDALELEPTDYVSLAILGAALTELGNYKEALSIFQQSLNINFNVEIESMIGYVYALQGNEKKARQIINRIESQPREICQPGTKLARIYMALGEKETTYQLLEQAYKEHNVDLVSLNTDPRWKAIREEERFKALVRRVGLPTN